MIFEVYALNPIKCTKTQIIVIPTKKRMPFNNKVNW